MCDMVLVSSDALMKALVTSAYEADIFLERACLHFGLNCEMIILSSTKYRVHMQSSKFDRCNHTHIQEWHLYLCSIDGSLKRDICSHIQYIHCCVDPNALLVCAVGHPSQQLAQLWATFSQQHLWCGGYVGCDMQAGKYQESL